MKPGRNDPCPCGSGRKFKKCHMGKEDDLALDGIDEFTDEMSRQITDLAEVNYGRCREIIDSLDIKELTGNEIGIRLVDLKRYSDLNLFTSSHSRTEEGRGGGVFINILKTLKTDPDNIYLAISEDIDDATFIHELAHVLDYLGGSNIMPGSHKPLSMETNVPLEHFDHPEEFAKWLDYLSERFDIKLDADDAIVSYLYKNGMLIKGSVINSGNELLIKTKSEQMFRFLSENSKEIDAIIQDRDGYIGPQENN
ncbi:YecA family protein [Thermodesulfobacteriota bacterium]